MHFFKLATGNWQQIKHAHAAISHLNATSLDITNYDTTYTANESIKIFLKFAWGFGRLQLKLKERERVSSTIKHRLAFPCASF